MIKTRLLLTVSAIAAITFGSPVSAQYKGTNERQWAKEIQDFINTGMPKDDICTNAWSSAKTSNEIAFKQWSYSIAKQYCEPGRFDLPEGTSQATESESAQECRLTQAQIYAISIGQKTAVREGNCYMSFH